VTAVTKYAINDMFKAGASHQGMEFFVSMFEIYGGKCMDLLNNKQKLQILEDKNNKIQVFGIEEKQAFSASDVHQIIDLGHSIRTTHQTAANDTSSRSHAICQV
jgi:kinesin family protein 2/24